MGGDKERRQEKEEGEELRRQGSLSEEGEKDKREQ